MDRLTKILIAGLGALMLLTSCEAKKTPDATPTPVEPIITPTEALFPSPYFPSRETELRGKAVAEWASDWVAATVYSAERLDERQKAFVAELGPAGGEGQVAPGFTGDFDGDGRQETVAYGAYAKANGEEGNFVLLTRDKAGETATLLLKELPGPPSFTVFTLKPDGSLWFGGGIDAGEVTMNIRWDQGQPTFSFLTEE